MDNLRKILRIKWKRDNNYVSELNDNEKQIVLDILNELKRTKSESTFYLVYIHICDYFVYNDRINGVNNDFMKNYNVNDITNINHDTYNLLANNVHIDRSITYNKIIISYGGEFDYNNIDNIMTVYSLVSKGNYGMALYQMYEVMNFEFSAEHTVLSIRKLMTKYIELGYETNYSDYDFHFHLIIRKELCKHFNATLRDLYIYAILLGINNSKYYETYRDCDDQEYTYDNYYHPPKNLLKDINNRINVVDRCNYLNMAIFHNYIALCPKSDFIDTFGTCYMYDVCEGIDAKYNDNDYKYLYIDYVYHEYYNDINVPYSAVKDIINHKHYREFHQMFHNISCDTDRDYIGIIRKTIKKSTIAEILSLYDTIKNKPKNVSQEVLDVFSMSKNNKIMNSKKYIQFMIKNNEDNAIYIIEYMIKNNINYDVIRIMNLMLNNLY
jgi:hypothetical protein